MKVTRRRPPARHPTADHIYTLLRQRLDQLDPAQLGAAAQAAGLSLNTLYTFKRGGSRPTLDATCALLAHLNVPVTFGAPHHRAPTRAAPAGAP